MHQTTVRFGRDLWDELTVAADRAGVSVAQFVRDAAVLRLASGGGMAAPVRRDGPDHSATQPRDSSER
jgi:hypothetical protein